MSKGLSNKRGETSDNVKPFFAGKENFKRLPIEEEQYTSTTCGNDEEKRIEHQKKLKLPTKKISLSVNASRKLLPIAQGHHKKLPITHDDRK